MWCIVVLVMSQSQNAADRTETKRFDDEEFDATDLIVGDRIDPSLVARTLDSLGTTWQPDDDATPTQLAEATITDRMDDVHSAILVDAETGRLVRASRHDSNSAWNQKGADWKVRAVGDRVVVEDAEVERDGNDEWGDADAAEEAERWVNLVLQDSARGVTDYSDELTLEGKSSLTLYEPYAPTKLFATISLEDTE